MQILNSIINNKELVIAGLGVTYTFSVTLASVIVKYAPNSTEGKYSEILLDFCNEWALNNKKRSE